MSPFTFTHFSHLSVFYCYCIRVAGIDSYSALSVLVCFEIQEKLTGAIVFISF